MAGLTGNVTSRHVMCWDVMWCDKSTTVGVSQRHLIELVYIIYTTYKVHVVRENVLMEYDVNDPTFSGVQTYERREEGQSQSTFGVSRRGI